MESGAVPIDGSTEADTLAGCVNSGVGSSGGVCHAAAPEETLQNPLEFDLDRATHRLALPPDKAGAVVVQYGEESPAHRPGI